MKKAFEKISAGLAQARAHAQGKSVKGLKRHLLPIPTPGEILLEDFLRPADMSQNALGAAAPHQRNRAGQARHHRGHGFAPRALLPDFGRNFPAHLGRLRAAQAAPGAQQQARLHQAKARSVIGTPDFIILPLSEAIWENGELANEGQTCLPKPWRRRKHRQTAIFSFTRHPGQAKRDPGLALPNIIPIFDLIPLDARKTRRPPHLTHNQAGQPSALSLLKSVLWRV